MSGFGEHRDAVYFDEEHSNDNKTKAAYRELRLWQKGYLAAVAIGNSSPVCAAVADEFVQAVNAKRAELLS